MFEHQLDRQLDKILKAKSSSRFIIPIIVLLSAKLLAGPFLYQVLNLSQRDSYWMTTSVGVEGQNSLLVLKADQVIRWPYLFLGWDSGWYLSIATRGYSFSSQSYAFYPGLPLFTYILNMVTGNPFVSMTLLSFIIGVIWLPAYQLVAENYMSKPEALKSTLLYGFFPYVFLFTTVAYSEGLLLLFSLAAWYFLKDKKLLLTGICASVAAISRPPGIFLMIPILLELLREYRHNRKSINYRTFISLMIPLVSFSS
jgi:Gpi18-like mannosyltransferase